MPSPAGQTRRFLIAASAAAILLGALWMLVYQNVTLEEIQRFAKTVDRLSGQRPVLVFFTLTAAQAIGMSLGLPTKALLTLLSGALLGAGLGFAATFLGVLAGTSALFVFVRRFARSKIVAGFGEKTKKIGAAIGGHPVRAMIGLRLFVVLPYGPCTIGAALSSMSFKQFVIGSALGDIPIIALYSTAGRELFSIASASQALSESTVVTLTAISALFLLSAIVKKKTQRFATKSF